MRENEGVKNVLGACRVRFIPSLEGEKAQENEGVEDVLGARRVRFSCRLEIHTITLGVLGVWLVSCCSII